jgi:uncharacterized protein (UPF0297 family)
MDLSQYEINDIENCFNRLGLEFSFEKKKIFSIIIEKPHLVPKIRGKINTIVDYVLKWDTKYVKGYNNRPSKKESIKSTTIPDRAVKYIFGLLVKGDEKLMSHAEIHHAKFMKIENLIGSLIEEYLHEKLRFNGWYCAWGESIKSVDFFSINGDLLQVKTSDNSENSSSARVREGTQIKKWFRRFSKKDDVYNWDELKKITGVHNISEEDFRKFSSKIILENPGIIN